MNRMILASAFALCIIVFWAVRSTNDSSEKFLKLKHPIVVESIDQDTKSAGYGSVTLRGANNITIAFDKFSTIAKCVRRSYIQGDTIKN